VNTLFRVVLRGAAYQLMRGLPRWLVVLAGVVALVLLVSVNGARAATYVNACVGSDPVCERLSVLVAEAEAHTVLLEGIEANTAGDGPAEVSGTVALSGGDRERLDLAWYGVWAAVGLLLVLMIAPTFLNLLRVTRGMGA